MARTFHLSCNGPLDTSEDAIDTLSHALSRLINDPRTLDRLLEATTTEPCRINTPHGTLAEARSMDSALMALGLFSEIFVLDSARPGHPGVFISERQGDRRGSEADGIGADAAPVRHPPAQVGEADASDKREKKGRRTSDR